ncbi:hypothetical protein NA57DRAFT_56715 [Rhizodiscina lignyota]|uniref:Uncharacterized protein n=1 Tax=Rhizodiscina lignyota TaxID=1504668 RepID=A0A9P4IDY8_9PEZI|nr:hypothetical protein NA57DRAFT_56715 [Rhizodiscina lignyota]
MASITTGRPDSSPEFTGASDSVDIEVHSNTGSTIKTSAHIDTGSAVNFISSSLAEQLGLGAFKEDGSRVLFQTLDGRPIRSKGEVVLSITMPVELLLRHGRRELQKEESIEARFHVFGDEAPRDFTVLLGRDFIEGMFRIVSGSTFHGEKDAKTSAPSESNPSDPVRITKSGSSPHEMEPDDNIKQTKSTTDVNDSLRLDTPDLHVVDSSSGQATAAIIFVHGRKGSWKDIWTSPGRVCWPLDLLLDAVPGALTVFSKWSEFASYSDLGSLARTLADNLLRLRLQSTLKVTAPVVFVCHGYGSKILQATIERLELGTGLKDDAVKDQSLKIIQRIQSVLIFDPVPSPTSVTRRLSGTERSKSKAWNLNPSVPIVYLRPLGGNFQRLFGLSEASRGAGGSLRAEPGSSAIYLHARNKTLMQFAGREDPNYKIVLQLILAHLGQVPSRIENLQSVEIIGNSTIYAANTGPIHVSGNATVYAFQTGSISSTGAGAVYSNQAGDVSLHGNAIARIQGCGDLNLHGNAMASIANSADVLARGQSIVRTDVSDAGHHDPVSMPSTTKSTLPQLGLFSLRPQLDKILKAAQSRHASSTQAPTVRIDVEWNLMEFLEEDFDLDQRLEDIFVLVGKADAPQGMTCGDYVNSRWHTTGKSVLKKVQSAIWHLRKEVEAVENYGLPEGHSSRSIAVLDTKWRTESRGNRRIERSSFRLRGDNRSLGDFGETIAWLVAALRPTNHTRSDFSMSDVEFSVLLTDEEDFDDVRCICKPKPMRAVKPDLTQCWHSLFKNTTIINCPIINAKPESTGANSHALAGGLQSNGVSAPEGFGLGLPFDGLNHLAALSGADTPVEYDGGLVLLGFSTILVPCQRLDNDGLQWHLVREEDAKKMISLSKIDDDKICQARDRKLITTVEQIHAAKRHFIGLWEDAIIALGTKQYLYELSPQDEFDEIKYDEVKASFSQSMSIGYKGVTLGKTNTTAYRRTQITRDPELETLSSKLDWFGNEAVIIYEFGELRRSWLVPKLSLILFATQAYLHFSNEHRDDGRDKILNYAEPEADGARAAWKILQPQDGGTTVKGFTLSNDSDTEKADASKTLLYDVLQTITTNLRRVSARASPGGGPLSWSCVFGYDLANLCSSPTLNFLRTPWTFNWISGSGSSSGWMSLTKTVPVFLCSRIPPPVRPVTEKENKEFDPPLNENHMVCPISALALVDRAGYKGLEKGKVTQDVFLHSPHTPFGNCDCQECQCPEDHLPEPRVQRFVNSDERLARWKNILDHKGAAILVAPDGKIQTPVRSEEPQSKPTSAQSAAENGAAPGPSVASVVSDIPENVQDLIAEMLAESSKHGTKTEPDDGQPEASAQPAQVKELELPNPSRESTHCPQSNEDGKGKRPMRKAPVSKDDKSDPVVNTAKQQHGTTERLQSTPSENPRRDSKSSRWQRFGFGQFQHRSDNA